MKHFKESKNFIQSKIAISLLVIVFLGIRVTASGLFEKMKLPGAIKITIQENSMPGEPLRINIVALSKIPFKDGHVELIIPEIGNITSQKVELWSGASDAPMEKHLEYVLPVLPIGEFKIIAHFEFKSIRESARGIRVSKTLYINVRSNEILSSDISPSIIKRAASKNELKEKEHIEQNIAGRKSGEKSLIIGPKEDKPGNIKPQNKKIKTKKAPLEGTKKFADVPVQTQEEKNKDNEKIHRKPSKIRKAPLVSSKKNISVSIQQDNIKKVDRVSKKAPLESIKRVAAITTGEEKEKKGSKPKSSLYNQSTEAQEKKKALKGGRK